MALQSYINFLNGQFYNNESFYPILMMQDESWSSQILLSPTKVLKFLHNCPQYFLVNLSLGNLYFILLF